MVVVVVPDRVKRGQNHKLAQHRIVLVFLCWELNTAEHSMGAEWYKEVLEGYASQAQQ